MSTAVDDGSCFTQSEVAKEVGVARQVVASWCRKGVLIPSGDAERDTRTRGREKRNYTFADLIAAVFAKGCFDAGHRGARVKDAIRMIQGGDEDLLKDAGVVTFRSNRVPGLARQALVMEDARGAAEVLSERGDLIAFSTLSEIALGIEIRCFIESLES